jgi:hypothetical protein
MNSDVLTDVWRSDNRQFAERFGRAMKQARVELGQGGSFAQVSKRAWAIDPTMREQFGSAVSQGLRRMWSNVDVRAEQSERIKQSYTRSLRRRRSETLRDNWATADFRERMTRARVRVAELRRKVEREDA